MALPSCFVCPGYAKIYVSRPHSTTGIPTTWHKLPHTIRVAVSPDVEDPAEVRTSDTGGKKVSACSGATSWTLEVTSAVCIQDWIYAYILASYTDTLASDDPVDPSKGAQLWFYIHWEAVDDTPDATFSVVNGEIVTNAHTDNAIYASGLVQPPPLEIDNDSSDPVTVEWTANINWGPQWPRLASGSDLGGGDPL